MFETYNDNLLLFSPKYAKQKDYWINKLSGEPTGTGILLKDRPKEHTGEGKRKNIPIRIPDPTARQVEHLSKGSPLSIYMILIAALEVVLFKYNDNQDPVIISPVYKPKVSKNTLNNYVFIRNSINGEMIFKEVLLKVRQSILDGYENQDYPSRKLVEYLFHWEKNADYGIISSIVSLLENIHDKAGESELNGALVFSFSFDAEVHRLNGSILYDPCIYDGDYLEQTARHFTKTLEDAAADINRRVSSFVLLSEDEKCQLLYKFNNTDSTGDSKYTNPLDAENITIHHLFEQQAAWIPDRIATMAIQSESPVYLSYRELNVRANRLACRLLEQGVGPDTIVGIVVNRSLEMVTAILGILKAGGTYLPIDAEYPENRRDYILKDSGARILLTPNLIFEATQFTPLTPLLTPTLPNNLAYVIYTSGTTGRPKGVILEHRSVLNLIAGLKQEIYAKYSSGLRVAMLSPFFFDASVKQIFAALLLGHSLYIVPEDTRIDAFAISKFYNKHQIEISDGTPNHLRLLLEVTANSENPGMLPVKHFIIGGEELSRDLVENFFKCTTPGVLSIANVYGPTECCVDTTVYQVSRENTRLFNHIPLGKPLPTHYVYIVSKERELLPIGLTGELCISGPCLARGYLNNPALTREKFILNPFVNGEQMYCTGDLARWMSNGNITFIGRLDQQVKIRGFRIELEEIESLLLRHETVKEAVVVDREDLAKSKYLTAYIVSHNPNLFKENDLREYLSGQLPVYCIPSFFMRIEHIPLNSNGKIDRKVLPAPQIENVYTTPRDEIEKKLAALWAEVLGSDTFFYRKSGSPGGGSETLIGIDDDFFRVGGQSLKATILASKVHKAFGTKLELAQVFKTRTIREMAAYLRMKKIGNTFSPIEPSEKKEYYTMSSAQKRLYILQQMEPQSTAYHMPELIPLEKEADLTKLEETFKKLIKRHESLRSSFHMVNDEPVQRVHDEVEFDLDIAPGEAENISVNDIRAFDLSQAPLLNVGLLTDREGNRMLLVDMHHIISDGVSHEILIQDFITFYKGEELAPLRILYKDFSQWQNKKQEQEKIKSQEKYWLKEFEGEIPVLELPTDYPRPELQSFEGSTTSFEIPGEEAGMLMKIALSEGSTLFMVLLAIFNILLSKLTSQEDIVVGTPIAGRRHADLEKIIGMFVNTLALRSFPTGEKTFREFVKEVKKRTLDAFENQEYQFEDLVDSVVINRDVSRNPLFDIMFALQNTDVASDPRKDERAYIPGIGSVSRESSLLGTRDIFKISKFDLSVAAVEIGDKILFSVEYCTKLFKEETIQKFVDYYQKTISIIVKDPVIKIKDIEVLTAEEKRKLLYEFNDTETSYQSDKVIHRLFEEQVERIPGSIAAVDSSMQISYGEINKKSNRLAHGLQTKSVEPDTNHIVGIMVERSVEMIIGIMGILKSGAAYLPIDPDYPKDRIDYMLNDSGAQILLADDTLAKEDEKVRRWEGEKILLQEILDVPKSNAYPLTLLPSYPQISSNLAYVIYTSGTTGRPKGVMVEHQNVTAYVNGFYCEFFIDERDTILQQASFSFDVFVEEVYPLLLSGGKIAIASKEVTMDPNALFDFLLRHDISIISVSPLLLNEIDKMPNPGSLRILISGGAVLKGEYIRNLAKKGQVYNTYGPTETTVCASYYKCSHAYYTNVPIGKPIANYKIYILNRTDGLLPIGVPGELSIAGDGVTRGYLNRPELTAEKFVMSHLSLAIRSSLKTNDRFHNLSPNDRLYKTGDLARFLNDGNIEFLGRIDHQVKIRGYRIELGEIESLLLNYPGIKEAVVLAQEEEKSDKYLCAYIVSDSEYRMAELREYLLKQLPDYMIPSYFARLEKIPLTSNGKVDRKALPKPEVKAEQHYRAPRNRMEATLVGLWAEVLNIQPDVISIDRNFFELGGHSLKAMILVSKIHKVFDVKFSLAEIFKMPRIKELAKYIKENSKDYYKSIKPAEKKEYCLLSSAQKRLYILQQMNLDSTAYNMPEIIPLSTTTDLGKIEETFNKLIKRHESLRTSFRMVNDTPVQVVHDEVEFEIENYQVEVKVKVEKEWSPHFEGPRGPAPLAIEPATRNPQPVTALIRSFIRPFDLSQTLLFRVGLIALPHTPTALRGHPRPKTHTAQEGKKDRYLLLVDMHHIISDGVSHEILVKDFMRSYEGEELPLLRIQYKDFSQWQNSEREQEKIKSQEKYWLKEFEGEIPVIALPIDYPRPAIQNFTGGSTRFEISADATGMLKRIALSEGSTLFMVLLAIFNILLSKLSSQEDIIVGTPIAGRQHADLEKIIGMFVNTLALRNFPVGEKTFREFFKEMKERTLDAFENQGYQFEDLVEKVSLNRDTGRNPLFDVMFVLQNIGENKGEAQTTGFENEMSPSGEEQYGYKQQTSKFDLTLNAVEYGSGIGFIVAYCTKLFSKETIEKFSGYFKKTVLSVISSPGKKIWEIDIISEEEKEQALYKFNHTRVEYPTDKTLHQLFEEQAAGTPGKIAVIFQDSQLTYNELNGRSNRLAGLLREKGVKPGNIVGILLDRSLEMIISILAILKSGGAYAPLDPQYPMERIKYILDDSKARILLSRRDLPGKLKFGQREDVSILDVEEITGGENLNLAKINRCNDVAYIIYTSGSTGAPRGVMIEHYSAVNLVFCQRRRFQISEQERILQFSSISFDASVEQIFISLCSGAALVLIGKEALLDEKTFEAFVARYCITHIHAVPSFLKTISLEKRYELKRVIGGGDICPISLAQQWYHVCDFYNEYGPTETTVTSIEILVENLDCSMVQLPIGKPLDNTTVYILDRGEKPVPIHVMGELYIGGAGVGRGYLNHVDLTAKKFKTNPFSEGGRFYQTGDLGRWLPDGNIEFLGRIDHQIKIRGYRIELGEIEGQLLKHPRVKEAVAVTRGHVSEDIYLCGYIVAYQEVSPAELREHLSKELPGYMIPSYFVFLGSLPLTPNGKVDRKALPEAERAVGESYVAPRDEVEKRLVEIWSEVLKLEKAKIGIDANFFELGGHSLKAMILVSKIHKEFEVRVPLVDIFKAPRIKTLARYLKGKTREAHMSIRVVEKREYHPLSSAQKRIYILQQMELGSTAYNMPEFIPLEMNFDLTKIEETFKKLIKRHESLRTSFHLINDIPVQKVHDNVGFAIEGYESGSDGKEPGEFIRPFDLSQCSLLRVGLVKNTDGSYLLLIDMHHIISDGVSHEIVVKDFMGLYEGEALPPLRIQYKDFSQWQNSEREQEKIKSQEKYWLKEFEGEIPVLELPTDYPRPTLQSFAGSSTKFEISSDEAGMLKEMALSEGATMFMILVAIFNILLSKLSNQEDIIIGTPIAGRQHADLEKIIGMFVNTLALRNFPVGEKTFREFFKEMKERTLDTFENQGYPFEDLVDLVVINRDVSRNPLFDVMFIMQNITSKADNQSNDATDIPVGNQSKQTSSPNYNANIPETSKFDLTLIAVEAGRELVFSFQYCTKIFKKETIERFIIYFKKLASSIAENPEKKLSQIHMISEEEKKQILYDFNDTREGYPKDKTLHQLFEEQVEKKPDNIALIGMGYGAWSIELSKVSITYRELNKKSDQLVPYLMKKGVQSDTIVGIMVERSVEMVIGILGILKTGSSYLPIDPTYLGERIKFMLIDSHINILLTTRKCAMSLEINFVKEIIYIEEILLNQRMGAGPGSVPTPSSAIDSPHLELAYVIYTSGSTGKPKGVAIQHRSLINFIKGITDIIPFKKNDTILCLTTICFDIFGLETLLPLTRGCKVVIGTPKEQFNSDAAARVMVKDGISTLQVTPSRLVMLMEDQDFVNSIKRLTYLLVGGEAFPRPLLENVRKIFSGKIYNLYGPTETTIWSMVKDVTAGNSLNIGTPIANTQIYILSKYHNLQSVGIVGELCIGGDGLARGYLNNSELTAEKFIKNPFVNVDDEFIYRTGDLARWLPDGNVELLGRTDYQVKIRGYRIELGEIENQILKHKEIKEVVVLARESRNQDAMGDKYLCAYFIPTNTRAFEKVSSIVRELKSDLSQSLPHYMIPSYFMQLDEIPLTPNGKVDRKALPVPQIKAGDAHIAPRDKVEEKLVEIWAKILDRDNVLSSKSESYAFIGIDNDFFELGGHSLKAAVMVSKIYKEFRVRLPLLEIFKTPTIRRLAEYIRNTRNQTFKAIADNLVLLKENSDTTLNIFFIHDGTGEVEGYVQFCQCLDSDINCWGIRADKLESLAPQNWTIEQLSRMYVEKIKDIQPQGPYYIAGWSLGGIIAFEILRQLENMNEEINFMALIDSPPPYNYNGVQKSTSEFDLQSELDYIKNYSLGSEIREKLKNVTDLNQFWQSIAEYLETNDYDVEMIKKAITEFGMHALPNYKQLNIKESIYYLNRGRTFHQARKRYAPDGKIHTPVHYFAASESKYINEKQWNQYTIAPIEFYKIAGDHFSILKKPHVARFSKLFNNILENIRRIPINSQEFNYFSVSTKKKLLAYLLRGGEALLWPLSQAGKYAQMIKSFMNRVQFQLTTPIHPDDIFIATYPKSGTTWMQMIMYQLTTDGNMNFKHIEQKVPFWEELELEEIVPSLNSVPRIFKTHLQYKYVPKYDCKYIYIVRDYRDVAVSYYYHQWNFARYRDSFDRFLYDVFLNGNGAFQTNWFQHVNDWYLNGKNLNILYLKYEDMKKDLPGVIRQIIKFCGFHIDEAKFERVIERSSFAYMKQHEEKFNYSMSILLKMGLASEGFIRKGQVGGWREYFNEEQLEECSRLYRQWIPWNIDLPYGSPDLPPASKLPGNARNK